MDTLVTDWLMQIHDSLWSNGKVLNEFMNLTVTSCITPGDLMRIFSWIYRHKLIIDDLFKLWVP